MLVLFLKDYGLIEQIAETIRETTRRVKMQIKSQKLSTEYTGKVFSNAADRSYHKQTDCRWMLPTDYQETEIGEITRQGKKPCKNCAA
jgi:hypothetical protein